MTLKHFNVTIHTLILSKNGKLVDGIKVFEFYECRE